MFSKKLYLALPRHAWNIHPNWNHLTALKSWLKQQGPHSVTVSKDNTAETSHMRPVPQGAILLYQADGSTLTCRKTPQQNTCSCANSDTYWSQGLF